jgi:hypothetical protein
VENLSLDIDEIQRTATADFLEMFQPALPQAVPGAKEFACSHLH